MSEKKRILYIATEMSPYLEMTEFAEVINKLAIKSNDSGLEVRCIMPRFGVINERRHRLHEVVRLSGINVQVDSDDYPLQIKVASLPNARLQVYFLENEDFFKRKHIFHDENETWFDDKETNCTAIRFFNVFGEGQRSTGGYRSAVPIFLEQYQSFKPITVTGDGSQTRDWIYVGDIVNALIEQSNSEYQSDMPVYNVGSGAETQVIEVAEALGGEIIHIEKRDEPHRSCADISLITNQLKWRPETNLLSWIQHIK